MFVTKLFTKFTVKISLKILIAIIRFSIFLRIQITYLTIFLMMIWVDSPFTSQGPFTSQDPKEFSESSCNLAMFVRQGKLFRTRSLKLADPTETAPLKFFLTKKMFLKRVHKQD